MRNFLKRKSNKDYSALEDSSFKSTRTKAKNSKRNFNIAKIIGTNPVSDFINELVKNKDIRKKIFFTLFIILIFRALANIPLPGVDMGVYKEFFGSSSTSETSLLFSIFTGGQVDTPSVVGLGIAAFINASIMIQLLTPVIPKLTELQKEGERGRQAITQYTRYLTLVLGLIYSAAFVVLISKRDLNSSDALESSSNPTFLIPRALGSNWPSIEKVIFMAIVLTAGSILVMWLSEQITDKGIGNGSSVVITVGILSNLPSLLKNDFSKVDFSSLFQNILDGNLAVLKSANILSLFGVLVGAILMMISIIYISEAIRKLPISYASRVRDGGKSGQESNLPLKLTLTGVLPIIFATAMLSFPQVIVPMLNYAFKDKVTEFTTMVQNSFILSSTDGIVDHKDFVYAIAEFILIVIFGVFYAFIVLKPKDTAENLQKSGGFIPGIRPGKQTENYISIVLTRISFAGAFCLAFIALVPIIARNLILGTSGISLFILTGIAGTSILIVVSVVIDTVRQYNSLKVTRSYERYTR